MDEATAQHSGQLSEAARLELLARYAILGTPPEPEFDQLVQLAASIYGMPIALLGIFTSSRLWLKARQGELGTEIALDESFESRAAWPTSGLQVPDACADPRFADHPWVSAEPGIRAYVSVPLVSAGGWLLGCLAVADVVPHQHEPALLRALQALAVQAVRALDRQPAHAAPAVAHTSSATTPRLVAPMRSHRYEALRVASQLARVAGWTLDVRRNRLRWTENTGDLFALPLGRAPTPEEALALCDPGCRPALQQALTACVREGKSFDVVVWLAARAGLRRWIRVLGRASRDVQGVVTRVRGSIQDVSEQMRAEEALRASEERFKYLAKASADAVWDWDLTTDVTTWSDGLYTLFGVPPEEFLLGASGWAGRVHPDDRVRVVQSLNDALGPPAARSWSAEYRFRRGDGSYAEVSDRGLVIHDEHGRAARMVGGLTDLRGIRHAAEEARRDDEARAGIVRIQQELASLDLGLQSVLNITAERVCALTNATGCQVGFLDGDDMVCQAVAGETATGVGARLPLEGSLTGLALQRGEVMLADDVPHDPRVIRDLSDAMHLTAIIVAPLTTQAGPIGALKVISNKAEGFSQRDVLSLQTLALSLGSVIQRHRAAETLRHSEEHYRVLFGDNPQPVWVYDYETLAILAANGAAIRLFGYTEAELLKMTLADLVPEEDHEQFAQVIESVRVGRPLHGVHNRNRRKDGSLVQLSVAGQTISLDGRKARIVQGVDITEQLRTERELSRVSRAQALLSACNESQVRATSEAALLENICRITVEKGGYAAAWVGFARDDVERTVEVMARWGEQTDVLSQVRVSWDENSPYGKGPSGLAIRSGQLAIVEDISQNEGFKPWAALAQERNIRGQISLPLRDNGRTFGALLLYSVETLHIGSDEVRLLEALANDLAFGIVSLRAREQQQHLQEALVKVALAVSDGAGTTFFDNLGLHMADALNAQVGVVAQLHPPDEPVGLRSLSLYVNGSLWPNRDLPLNGAMTQLMGQTQFVVADVGHLPSAVVDGVVPWREWVPGVEVRGFAGFRLDNREGQPVGLICVLFDAPLLHPDLVMYTLRIFAARATTELERQQYETRLLDQASLLDKAQDAIIVRDLQHRIVYWNRSAQRVYGWAADEVIGTSVAQSAYRDPRDFDRSHAQLMADGEWTGELAQRRKDGQAITIEAHWTLVRDSRGKPVSVLAINTDISQRKRAEREIQQLAFYDPLTQLPNRLLLMDRLQQALTSTERSKRGGALLFIDLDNFKTLNDTLGHDQGDLLLQQVAQRLRVCVRQADSVARLGGDEFVVMLEDLGGNIHDVSRQARLVADKVLAALNAPYQLSLGEYQSSASVGIAPFTEEHAGVGELLKQADIAMYQSKSAGRNTVRFFDPALQAAVTGRAALEVDMRSALTQNEFFLHYQPQVDGDGRMTGVEALIRWQHAQQGMVSPVRFIPVAEETGIIVQIGRRVLRLACEQLAAWALRPETEHLIMSVNVSSRQFRHPDFVTHVMAELQRSGARPPRLKLELTESLMVDDMDLTIDKMSELQRLGVGFSLDDFGTGYSSLAYLKRLPLDQLKIDQSFVRDVLTDPNDAVIARTIIGLGRNLGLEVIAEGVETEEQRQFLADNGCRAYQGYLFSKPLPADALEAYIQHNLPQGSQKLF